MIELAGVTHRYGDRTVLRHVTLTLRERRVAVIGANGSGKSTLARTLNGLVVPSEGSVRVNGHDTRTDGAAVRRDVGFVFTDPDAQIVMPTVGEDVAFSLRRSGISRSDRDARVADVLRRFGLDGHADHPAHLLSGGQKQLLALASVLVTEPKVLVCDEPQQVVLVTHHLDLVADYERVLVIHEAGVAHDGPAATAVPAYLRLMQA